MRAGWRCEAVFDGHDLVVANRYRDIMAGSRGDAIDQCASVDDGVRAEGILGKYQGGQPGEGVLQLQRRGKIGTGSIAAIISGHGAAFDIESTRGAAYRGALAACRGRMLARS